MISLSEHIEDSCESVVVGWEEGIYCFGYAGGFRCGNEEQQDGEDCESQGYQVCLAFAGHFIVAEETQAQGAEEGNDQSGQGEDAEEDIGHEEADEEDRQENEGQVIGDEGGVHMAAHIIQPVGQVEAEEAQGDEGQEDDFVPDAGEAVSVLAQPVEEYTDEEGCNAADDVVEIFRNEFHRNHGKGGEDGACCHPPGNLAPGGSFVLRHVVPHLRQDFRYEEKKENSQGGEGVDEEGYDDEEYRNKDFISLKHLEVFEIQFFLLGINGKPHEYQVGQHDTHRFHRLTAQIKQGAENKYGRICSCKTADKGTEKANIQEGHNCVTKIQNVHLLYKQFPTIVPWRR